MELSSKTGKQYLCLLTHMVYMGIKFREDLFSRVLNFAIFYNREKREIKDPRK